MQLFSVRTKNCGNAPMFNINITNILKIDEMIFFTKRSLTQPVPHGKNQEGGEVQGLSAHLLHPWCPPRPHGLQGQGSG